MQYRFIECRESTRHLSYYFEWYYTKELKQESVIIHPIYDIFFNGRSYERNGSKSLERHLFDFEWHVEVTSSQSFTSMSYNPTREICLYWKSSYAKLLWLTSKWYDQPCCPSLRFFFILTMNKQITSLIQLETHPRNYTNQLWKKEARLQMLKGICIYISSCYSLEILLRAFDHSNAQNIF